MIFEAFIVEDYNELFALQRVFREAKFCIEPDDLEVSDSPIVASMFERLIAALMTRDIARDGDKARQRWEQWLAMDDSRDEWHAAIRRARANNRWPGLSSDERKNYVALLFSPFKLSPDACKASLRRLIRRESSVCVSMHSTFIR